jgi:hypothetical protein
MLSHDSHAAHQRLVAAVARCLPDLEHYASTRGPGPDVRLAELLEAMKLTGNPPRFVLEHNCNLYHFTGKTGTKISPHPTDRLFGWEYEAGDGSRAWLYTDGTIVED